MSRKATPAEVDDLARQFIVLCQEDLEGPQCCGMSPNDHADKIGDALLSAYAMLAAVRREPEDEIEYAKKFFESPVTRERMSRQRALVKREVEF